MMASAPKVGLDYFTVSQALKPGIKSALTLASATAQVGNLGTGATSGNYTLGLMRNGTLIASFVIPFNSLTGAVDVDLRSLTSLGANGIKNVPGDVLRLDLLTVPVGLTAGGSDFKVNLTVKTHAIDC